MKLELLVNAYQHGALNTFSGLVHTARHVMKLATPEVDGLTWFTRKQSPKVGLMIGTKS